MFQQRCLILSPVLTRVMNITDREAGRFSNTSQEALKLNTANSAWLP
jgi:hypothetical protein